MTATLKRKFLLASGAMTGLFVLNAMWLAHLMAPDRPDLHQSPIYPTYIAFRKLLLQPGTIAMFGLAFGIWLLLIYRKTRKQPLAESQKVTVLTILLAVVYGFVLIACFRL
jgi:hypothetical protein